jgi:hypothetical protein
VSAFVVGAFLAILFGFLGHNRNSVPCTGCASGRVIGTRGLYSTKYVQWSQMVNPGVWVDGSPRETAIDEHVANGTLVGYCRSVRAFQAHNPEIPFATKCWRA